MTTTPAPTDIDTRARALYSWQARIDALTAWDALAAEYTNVLNDRQLGWAKAQEAQHALTAAREELAKTRAELETAKAALDRVRAETLLWAADRIDPGPSRFWPDQRSQTWDDSLATRRGVAANLRFWVDRGYLGPLSEANPATTAEPADGDAEDVPCKTCGKPWRNRRHECQAEPADEPKATCGAVCPDITTITCTMPPDHPPVPIMVSGIAMPMAHFSKPYATAWNPNTALIHNATPEPADEPDELCSDKNGFHDGHDWTPDPCEPYRWCPGYPVPAAS